jgi:hypothetical protein
MIGWLRSISRNWLLTGALLAPGSCTFRVFYPGFVPHVRQTPSGAFGLHVAITILYLIRKRLISGSPRTAQALVAFLGPEYQLQL